ncbi:MAG: uroporphyrinogen-III C-methyltransferase [Arenicellales bacterium]
MSVAGEKCGPCGKVYLVGAGPGDPDLLTVRAMRLLSTADVVVYDRLISREILNLVPVGVSRIAVGKYSGYHSVCQDETNKMLVALAKSNRCVIRLKGGDPFVFGRGGEEALYMRRSGIAFEVVPGITAAVACSAYAGIPLTHRGVSKGFRVVTGHLQENGSLELDWDAMIDPESTLVIYMGLGSLAHVAQRLQEAGLDPETPAAAIQDGTTSKQKAVYGTLASLGALVQQHNLQPPTLIVIGHSAALGAKLAWFDPLLEQEDEYAPSAVWAGC